MSQLTKASFMQNQVNGHTLKLGTQKNSLGHHGRDRAQQKMHAGWPSSEHQYLDY